MRLTVLTVHIITASLGLLAGFVALYASKGAALHRRSGTVFVYAMVTMSILGVGIAAVWNVAPSTNIPVGLLTAYLVTTSLITVRPATAETRRLNVGLMLVVMAVTLFLLLSGLEAMASGKGHGVRAFPYFMFGSIGLLAIAGDIRVLRSGIVNGAGRLARHLWRMSVALLIASLSFSVQLPKYLPRSMRIPAPLALPTVAVLATMLYWLWRVRSRKPHRAVARITAREAA